jgi:ATP-dependent DNA ligase
MNLPIQPPFPPMEAEAQSEIPLGREWQYEPKWDGFRCLAFRDGSELQLQSKSCQPLGRYFPEVMAALQALKPSRFVLDGELAVPIDGKFDFDALLQRIHPAASRVAKLARETPALYVVFDLLVTDTGDSLVNEPLSVRRKALEAFSRRWLQGNHDVVLSPQASDLEQAQQWLGRASVDLDGIIAKDVNSKYRTGEREGMVKIKKTRTADCVVGGFRYAENGSGIGSLLLGLYNSAGLLDHVGFCSSFKAGEKQSLVPKLRALIEAPGFTGRAPGGPSRWSTKRSAEWQPLRPELVVEVGYDHFTGGRFRHGTRLLRWRPDKAPEQCCLSQISHAGNAALRLLHAA